MMGSRIGLPITEKCWKQAGGRFESRAGQVPDRIAGGGWLVFAGGPAAALAASHLRSPATFTVQLDHLLSSVAQVNHTAPEIRRYFRGSWRNLLEILHCRQRRRSARWRAWSP